ncbi:glycosyltransferase [Paenibacillus sp. sptzw28]|uniref:glycosyltransferase n=1 Tax=Paenibacillus sp. sptzw28 TaxID=715179 RepID=UPI001C6EE6CA|nr:glycosyltransferase [Paenibacillus sp. sptzw28]QYR21219.1 glycosyltransferase [Paenibacillus sp. sptzw28]
MGKWADVIIVQGTTLFHYPLLKSLNKPLVVDLYDPFILENLELRGNGLVDSTLYQIDIDILKEQIVCGDYYICSNDRQVDFWLGCIAILGKINPKTYRHSHNSKEIIGVVPMGIPSEEPEKTNDVRRQYGVKENDFLAIWAGGVWEWLDIETLLQAFVILKHRHPYIKLLVMGAKEDEKITAFCKDHQLLDNNVILSEWVPYENRQNYLLSSNVGVITHFDNFETRYSYRTRVLDYIWCNIPVITTEGDYFSQVITKNNIGKVVKFKDAKHIADSLIDLYQNPGLSVTMRENIKNMKSEFYWENTIKDLMNFCYLPRRFPSKRSGANLTRTIVKPILMIAKKLLHKYKKVMK